jgi:hypothetical protein
LCAIRWVNFSPAPEALREPTTATIGSDSARVAADGDQRRYVVDHLQALRIVGFTQRHQGNAELLGGGKLALGVGARANLHGATGAAPARE